MAASLDGQVAIVTGASRGIGFAIASELARAGASILLVSRSIETIESVSSDASWITGHTLVVDGGQVLTGVR